MGTMALAARMFKGAISRGFIHIVRVKRPPFGSGAIVYYLEMVQFIEEFCSPDNFHDVQNGAVCFRNKDDAVIFRLSKYGEGFIDEERIKAIMADDASIKP